MPKSKTLAQRNEVQSKSKGLRTKLSSIKAEVVKKRSFLNRQNDSQEANQRRVTDLLDRLFPVKNDKKRKEAETFLVETCNSLTEFEKRIRDLEHELSALQEKMDSMENGVLFELFQAYKQIPSLSAMTSRGTRIYSREPISMAQDSPFI